MATYRDPLPTRQAASSRKTQWNRGVLLLLLSRVQHGCWRSRSPKAQNSTVQGDNQQDWPTGTNGDGFVPDPLQNCVTLLSCRLAALAAPLQCLSSVSLAAAKPFANQ